LFLEELSDWQYRTLALMDPIVFPEAVRVKIRDAGSRQVKNMAVHVALGLTPEGKREILSLWIANIFQRCGREGCQSDLSQVLF